MTSLPEIGSVWYVLSDHYEVVEHGVHEGEGAVRFRNVRTGKTLKVWTIWRIVERRAVPSSAEVAR